MAREARVSINVTIRNGNLNYRPGPRLFNVDVFGAKGPTPGAIAVSTSGTDVDLGELTTPGLVIFSNLEDEGGNYYEFGIKDASSGIFFPLGECLPGESWPLRFTRNLLEEYLGTGTTGPVNTLHLRANSGAVTALVEAFEA